MNNNKLSKQKKNRIKNDLLIQLESQNKIGHHYFDLINDYMQQIEIKELLEEDIVDTGLRRITTSATGIVIEKSNESIVNLQKTISLMLKILSELNLKEPIVDTKTNKDDDSYY
jgi:hypothetical protein